MFSKNKKERGRKKKKDLFVFSAPQGAALAEPGLPASPPTTCEGPCCSLLSLLLCSQVCPDILDRQNTHLLEEPQSALELEN